MTEGEGERARENNAQEVVPIGPWFVDAVRPSVCDSARKEYSRKTHRGLVVELERSNTPGLRCWGGAISLFITVRTGGRLWKRTMAWEYGP